MKFIERFLKNLFPERKNNVWYNLHAHDRSAFPIIWDKEGKYIPCRRGVKLIMGKTPNGENIYWEVVRYWEERPWSDWLYASDCIHCDMKFSHIEPILNPKD